MKYEIKRTKNYQLFTHSKDNRGIELGRTERKALEVSMKKYGFIPAFPIVCYRREGRLVLKDGQGRLATAQKLGLEVYYVVVEQDFDLAQINGCVAKWNWNDFATKFAADGNDNYQQVMEFSAVHGIKIATAATILCGNDPTGMTKTSKKFKAGTFEVRSTAHAETVARAYNRLGDIQKSIRNKKLIRALHMLVCVPGFDIERLLSGAKRQPERLVNFGTTDAYLSMLEDVYNFGRKVKEPVKIAAENVARAKNPIHRGELKQESSCQQSQSEYVGGEYMHA